MEGYPDEDERLTSAFYECERSDVRPLEFPDEF